MTSGQIRGKMGALTLLHVPPHERIVECNPDLPKRAIDFVERQGTFLTQSCLESAKNPGTFTLCPETHTHR